MHLNLSITLIHQTFTSSGYGLSDKPLSIYFRQVARNVAGRARVYCAKGQTVPLSPCPGGTVRSVPARSTVLYFSDRTRCGKAAHSTALCVNPLGVVREFQKMYSEKE